ncbi:MAG: hypothetical protein MJ064_09420 [Lachnospiraceae bacterium]|nr:hypothetical protein [Lachnospiraceae bacterium]
MGLFGFGKNKEAEKQAVAEASSDEQEMLDRLCSRAGNIIAMLKSVLSGKNGTDLYIVTLYAAGLAGIACHEAVKAVGEPMVEVECANGKKYYMGDAVNRYLHENKYSVTGFACAITNMPQSSVLAIVERQANAMGTERYVVAGNMDPVDLYKHIKGCWDGIKDNMTLSYCKRPEEWPVLYGIVMQNVVREALNLAPKEAIFNTAVDVACALSKMDLESL